jgi:hypothetical protein
MHFWTKNHIKFLIKFVKNVRDIYQMLEHVYGNKEMGRKQKVLCVEEISCTMPLDNFKNRRRCGQNHFSVWNSNSQMTVHKGLKSKESLCKDCQINLTSNDNLRNK